jgi:hypothetical protein
MFADENAIEWDSRPPLEAAQESAEAYAKKIEEAESLLSDFEARFEELRAITYFATQEERNASPRAQALKDLDPLNEILNWMRLQTDQPRDAYRALRRRKGILTEEVLGSLRAHPSGVGEIVERRAYVEKEI